MCVRACVFGIFVMNIFCVKDRELQAFHALIVEPEVVW